MTKLGRLARTAARIHRVDIRECRYHLRSVVEKLGVKCLDYHKQKWQKRRELRATK